MPTPKEWLDNLERLQKISGTIPGDQVVEEHPSQESREFPLEVALAIAEIIDDMGVAAEILLEAIDETPPEGRRDVTAGFLTALVIRTIEAVAYEQNRQEESAGLETSTE